MASDRFEKIVALAKRRGFVFPSSEIYGGLANVYDYGPNGVELLRNIRSRWWQVFVRSNSDIVGLESAIFMHPKVWDASGHLKGFSDPMVEDKKTRQRYRADHLIEDWIKKQNREPFETDNLSPDDMNEFIATNKITSPEGNSLSPVRQFNLMFSTQLGATENDQTQLYLRAETAQGMYVDFKNILDSTRLKIPFGVAQQGRVFRNEITTGKFLFRMLEFQQMEIQFFFNGKNWQEQFEAWRERIENWYFNILGVSQNQFRWKPHTKLIFYAKAAEDIQYQFPWGFDEVSGLHYRTDYDLTTHMKHSGQNLEYVDTENNTRYIPHVLETTWGLDRNFMLILDAAYIEEDARTYLKLPYDLAPYQIAVFPLVRNKPELTDRAQKIFRNLQKSYATAWDDRGNIGKRYYAQDEIGTPWCITVDYQTLEDNTVTVRDRDTTNQTRINADQVDNYLEENLTLGEN